MTTQSERAVIGLKYEGGKSVTIQTCGADVAIIVWRKNGGALLPLRVNIMEAQRLRSALDAAIVELRDAE